MSDRMPMSGNLAAYGDQNIFEMPNWHALYTTHMLQVATKLHPGAGWQHIMGSLTHT